MTNRPIIALTAGDVSGIGPEILLKSLSCPNVQAACQPLVICDPDALQRARALCPDVNTKEITEVTAPLNSRQQLNELLVNAATSNSVLCYNPAGHIVEDFPKGQMHAPSGHAAFQYLTAAIQFAKAGIVDGIATAPLNKAALHAAGHHYPGHTEILAEQCGVDNFAMMLHLPESRVAPLRSLIRTSADTGEIGKNGLSVAHVTLHTSIESVPELLTTDAIVETTQLMHDFLKRSGCERRAIAVCALNPHGGETGLFGDEEVRTIEPAVRRSSAVLPNITGPLPVDTLIRRAVAGEFDGVVAMYHDQGHIPVKLLGFDAAINITLGLPIVRTSPTHGTAFDRAWNPATPADPAGMTEAILMAAKLC